MKIDCVLKKKPVHLKNVHSDTAKHSDIFTNKEFSDLEKTALMHIRKSIQKILNLKK